jgi:imidazolonepropionase-like amidohydrolase
MAVLLQDGRIARVGAAETLAADVTDADVLDATGCTLIPGMFNLHAHLCSPNQRGLPRSPDNLPMWATRNARFCLATGQTTIRDAGCPERHSLVVRDAIEARILAGPRVVACGRGITTSAGHGWRTWLRADTADELKKAVRELVEEGVDHIKVAATGGGGTPGSNVGAAQYSADELKVLVAEARRLGKRVAAHCNGTAGTRNAVEAGVDSIEHCGWMGADGKLEFDQAVVQQMLDKGTTVVPTCSVWYRPGYEDWDSLSDDQKNMRAAREERAAAWKAMYQAGVRFATGTDTWDPLGRELELMVDEIGLTPLQALVAATRTSAETLGIEDVGTIEPGKQADLVLVDGDPAADIRAVRNISRVYRAGRLVAERGLLPPE